MKQSVGTDTIKLSISKIITTSIALVSAMLLSRFRTLEEYGTYSQLLIVINLVTTIIIMGLPNSINYFLTRAETIEDRQRFVSVYYTLSTILSVFTGLVLVLGTPLFVGYFNNRLLEGFWYFLAVFPWTLIIITSIENVLIVYRRTSLLMLFRILNSVCIILSIIAVQLLKMDFYAFMIIYLSVQAVFALSVYAVVKKITGKISILLDGKLIKRILSFSLPVGLASTVSLLNIQLGRLIIGRFFTVDQLAIYTNASTELPVTIFATSLTAVLMPQLVRLLKADRNRDAVALWGDATSLSYLILCFFAAGLIVFAPDVISLLYSDKYLPGVEVFRIFCLALLFRCAYFGIILNSMGKTKYILYSSLASLALNAVLNYAFYLLFGFIGPAIATIIAIAVIGLVQLIWTSKHTGVPFSKVFPWRDMGFITVICIVMGVAFAFLRNILHFEAYTGGIVESVILGIVWGIIYIGILFRYIKRKWHSLNHSHI